MIQQPDLDQYAEERATDDAIATVGQHADDGWNDLALAAVRQVALTHPTFLVDDVWSTGLPEPHEARAIGNTMKRAAAEGLIVCTGDFRPSSRPGSHCVPRRVWRSLIYPGAS